MSIALYRQYRPQKFSDIIGQENIVETLQSQVKSGRLSHAYLFCGTRGVGKTTAARILARAANCLLPLENGEPCGKCQSCQSHSSADVDIIELDAASNNGVDYAREIRDKAVYLPTFSKFKIYIIDEVHMLSQSAFNALLKTLEEPPAHVIFILCTTEPQKIPATILSRCMRFDFRLVPDAALVKLIKSVYNQQGVSYTAEAADLIAACGEGSVRDALSVADRCLSFGGGTLDYDKVLDILGATNRREVFALADAVLTGDLSGALELSERLCASGKNVNILAKDLAEAFRSFLIIKSCKSGAQDILKLPALLFSQAQKIAQGAKISVLCEALENFTSAEYRLRQAQNPRLLFDALLIKIAVLENGGAAAAQSGEASVLPPKAEMQPQKAEITPEKDAYSPQKADISHQNIIIPPEKDAYLPQSQPISPPQPQQKEPTAAAKTAWANVLIGAKSCGSPLTGAVLSQISDIYAQNGKMIIPCTDIELMHLSKAENVAFLNTQLAPFGLTCEFKRKELPQTSEQKIKEIEILSGEGQITIL